MMRSLVLALILLSGISATASPLQYTSPYNVLVFGDMDATSSGAVGGAIAVQGNATFVNFQIAAAATNPSLGVNPGDGLNLAVGGDLNWTNGQLVTGSGVYEGVATLTNVQVLGGGTLSQAPVPVDFAALELSAQIASASFDAMPANGTIEVEGNIVTLTGTNEVLNIFTLSPAGGPLELLSGELRIVVPEGSAVLINIEGGEATFQNATLTLNGQGWSEANAAAWNEILWNFVGGGTLTIGGPNTAGSLLAPGAHVEITGTNFHGQVIAGSLTVQNDQISNFLFNGSPEVPIPEPSAAAFVGLGLTLLAIGELRRRAARQSR